MLDLIWLLFDIFQFIWNEIKELKKERRSRPNRKRRTK